MDKNTVQEMIFYNMFKEEEDSSPSVRPLYQFRKGRVDTRIRTAVFLHIIGGYPQTESYRIAFNYSGKPSSLASTASRFFNDWGVKSFARDVINYYSINRTPINQKYSVF